MGSEEIWIRNGVRVNPMNKHKKYGGWIFKECLPLCIVSPSAVMIHRSLFEEVGLFDETLPACEDYDLWLRIAYRFPIGLLDKPFVIKYGGHADQRSHAFEALDKFRIKSLIHLVTQHTLNPEQEHALRNTLQKKAFIYIKGARKRGKNEEAEALKKELSEVFKSETTYSADTTFSG